MRRSTRVRHKNRREIGPINFIVVSTGIIGKVV